MSLTDLKYCRIELDKTKSELSEAKAEVERLRVWIDEFTAVTYGMATGDLRAMILTNALRQGFRDPREPWGATEDKNV